MRTIAHISDLHFGAEHARVAEALAADLNARPPSLVVVSGDLTQRARCRQFAAAAAFLRQLPTPQICVPGNHDIPFYDVARRFLAPLTRYRRYIGDALNPWFQDEELAVLGLNTARSLTWKSGRISRAQIELIAARFSAAPRACFKVIVTHHPFIPPPGDPQAGIDLVGRAALALPVIDDCAIDLLLAGHLHHGYTGDVRAYYPATRRSVIVAQAGTAISHRVRREPNAYNHIRLEGDEMTLTVRVWNGRGFEESVQVAYVAEADEWRRRD